MRPWLNVQSSVISFRNVIVHYTPESDVDFIHSKKMEKKLRAKITESPFYKKTESFVARRAMSYSCAEWAINTTLKFVDEYCKILNIRNKFKKINLSKRCT